MQTVEWRAAIMAASEHLNPKALLDSGYGVGITLEMMPSAPGSSKHLPERVMILKGCDIYIKGAPCPMCMSAI
jgi:guanine deaminase